MKIDTRSIPQEGLALAEDIDVSSLDVQTDIVKFHNPLRVKADISKITNAVTIGLDVSGKMYVTCSRCLNEFEVNLNKRLKLVYPADKSKPLIDLDADIREEIIVDYQIKPLCRPDCKGLCPKCGKNLNEGGCSCATT